MRKTRNYFKKTGDIKGTFCAKMGMTKDRNNKKQKELRGSKNTKNYTKNILMTWITMMVYSFA